MGAGIAAGLFGGRGGKDSADDRESHLGDHGFSRAKGRHSSEESHSEYARNSSDRSSGSGNYNNGASSDAYADMHDNFYSEMRNSKPSWFESFKDCCGQVAHDRVFQSLIVLSAPIPKSSAENMFPHTRIFNPKGVSGFTTILSAFGLTLSQDKQIPASVKSILKTNNIVFRKLSDSSGNILRGVGRITQRYGIPAYAAGYVGACIYDQQLRD